jgi:Zn-dependent protease with chaperone function
MSSHDLLQAGATALKQQRYAEAVQIFENFCYNQTDAEPKAQIQAQMWLVKAYQANGQLPNAIALCQQMTLAGYPETVQTWAQKLLPTLGAPLATDGSETIPSTPSSDASAVGTGSVEATPMDAGASVCLGDFVAEPAPAASSNLSPEAAAQRLSDGNKALKMQRFADAVTALTAYCAAMEVSGSTEDSNYGQAQMWLVKAYKGDGQTEAAIALCGQLLDNEKEYIRTWAKQFYQTLAPDAPLPSDNADTSTHASTDEGMDPERGDRAHRSASFAQAATGTGPEDAHPNLPKAGRAKQRGIKLKMKGITANLAVASGGTLVLLFGMILVLVLTLSLIMNSDNPTQGFLTSVGITLLFNVAVFFLSPFIMDLIQQWFYQARWSNLSEVERRSPETARILREVCRKHNIQQPRLGIIEDDNPTAFTYGSLPNSARLVVSQGLFKYLDDDEVAAVYAHELGHIVHWDFAVMTLASTLVQITYLIYSYSRQLLRNLGDSDVEKQIKNGLQGAVWVAYAFYVVGEYLVLYLSRTREYYADHFAAEVTGNPNALSRALVKIAYGILEEGKRGGEPSRVLQGTRALGIADPKSAAFTGTAYRVAADPAKVGQVFLWDMFNPWAWWMELNSTHPLTGKRVRALSTYAEQLGIDVEFDMARVVREGKGLNKRKLYGSFALDLVLMQGQWIGTVLGAAIGSLLGNPLLALALLAMGFGLGTLLRLFAMYPDYRKAPATDILSLMADPYSSPLRGRPVKLTGEIIGRGIPGYQAGSELQLQDSSGLIFLRYASFLGPLGNFLFGISKAEQYIDAKVVVVGWFRRGGAGWVDLVRMNCDRAPTVNSYPRTWDMILGALTITLGIAMLPAALFS